jgi:protein phosphatase 1L
LGQGGSTAVTAILVNGRKLWVANVGDSRAVLLKGGEPIQMSVDHDPNVERSVIENRGGFVSNMPGDVPRVCGQLAVSRAFGDRNLKSLLRSEPDIKVEDIDHTAELLVLASDGLWKVWLVISKFPNGQNIADRKHIHGCILNTYPFIDITR